MATPRGGVATLLTSPADWLDTVLVSGVEMVRVHLTFTWLKDTSLVNNMVLLHRSKLECVTC